MRWYMLSIVSASARSAFTTTTQQPRGGETLTFVPKSIYDECCHLLALDFSLLHQRLVSKANLQSRAKLSAIHHRGRGGIVVVVHVPRKQYLTSNRFWHPEKKPADFFFTLSVKFSMLPWISSIDPGYQRTTAMLLIASAAKISRKSLTVNFTKPKWEKLTESDIL